MLITKSPQRGSKPDAHSSCCPIRIFEIIWPICSFRSLTVRPESDGRNSPKSLPTTCSLVSGHSLPPSLRGSRLGVAWVRSAAKGGLGDRSRHRFIGMGQPSFQSRTAGSLRSPRIQSASTGGCEVRLPNPQGVFSGTRKNPRYAAPHIGVLVDSFLRTNCCSGTACSIDSTRTDSVKS